MRRDPLRELSALLRAPEHGTTNLACHVIENVEVLGPALGVSLDRLRAFEGGNDEDVASPLRAFLEPAQGCALAHRRRLCRDRATRAAIQLGDTARWTELGAVLDVDVLLGELLTDRTVRYTAFDLPGSSVVIDTRMLAGCSWLRRVFIDLAAWVDEGGVHIRWRAGRGGLNCRPQLVPDHCQDRILRVSLRLPVAPRSAGRGAWLGEVLRDVGLLT